LALLAIPAHELLLIARYFAVVFNMGTESGRPEELGIAVAANVRSFAGVLLFVFN
jgi:hypothetical protein